MNKERGKKIIIGCFVYGTWGWGWDLGQGWSWCEGILCMVVTRQLWMVSRVHQTFRFGLRGLPERPLSPPQIFGSLVLALLERWPREKWERRVIWNECEYLYIINVMKTAILAFHLMYLLSWFLSFVHWKIDALPRVIF